MNGKTKILNINIDKITMDEAVKKALEFVKQGGFHCVFTPNPEIIWQAQKDSELMDILSHADMLLADGIGVVIASRIINNPLPERVAGFDFVCNLFKQSNLKFLFLGAKPQIAEKAAENLIKV